MGKNKKVKHNFNERKAHKFLQLFIFVGTFGLFASCNLVLDEAVLYEKGAHKLTTSRVIDGEYLAKALSKARITSTYPKHLDDPELEVEDEYDWTIDQDLSHLPDFQSHALIFQSLYNKALEDIENSVTQNKVFTNPNDRIMQKSSEISYGILLGLAIPYQDVARKSLIDHVSRGLIKKEQGPGGGWPITNDRIGWIAAAWELYLINGNQNWLRTAYNIASNSMEEDLVHLYDVEKELFRGANSIELATAQFYPDWMEAADIFDSYNLALNALYYQSLSSLAKMAEILQTGNARRYNELAELVRKSINKHFWMEEEGYYSALMYGSLNPIADNRSSTLGNAFCVIFDIADEGRMKEVVRKLPVYERGAPLFHPQTPNQIAHVNRAFWPIVQAFWNLATKKASNYQAFSHGLYAHSRAISFQQAHKTYFQMPEGSSVNSILNHSTNLGSAAASLSIVYQHFFGLEYQLDGLHFKPFIPRNMDADNRLIKLPYRDAVLNIRMRGYGDQIHAIYIGQKALRSPVIPHDLQGPHDVTIITTTVEDVTSIIEDESALPIDSNTYEQIDPLDVLDSRIDSGAFNIVEYQERPDLPRFLEFENGSVVWNGAENEEVFHLYQNGKRLTTTDRSRHLIANEAFMHYQLQVNTQEGLFSFLSEPIESIAPERIRIIEAENFVNAQDVKNAVYGYSGEGYLSLQQVTNSELLFEVEQTQKATIRMRFRYANGLGSVESSNQCAVRSLYLEDFYYDSFVMPTRGLDEWDNWGYSSPILITLPAGKHLLKVKLEDQEKSPNMPVVHLDYVELCKLQ